MEEIRCSAYERCLLHCVKVPANLPSVSGLTLEVIRVCFEVGDNPFFRFKKQEIEDAFEKTPGIGFEADWKFPVDTQ